MSRRFLGRVRLVTVLCVLATLVIIGRLYFLQILRGGAYAQRADAQFILPEQPLADRGTIYFTDKNGNEIAAATMEDGFALAINPQKITNIEQAYAAVESVASTSYSDFLAKAQNTASQYQLIADHLPTATGESLESQNIPGLIIEEDRWRYYPGDSLAAQVLGFVAYNGSTTQSGQYGLESYYNSTLTRTDDDLYANFFAQLFSGVQSVLTGAPQTGDLVTTIEPTVQAQLETVLAEYQAQWHSQFAGGIIMDPTTGAIYAMALNPTFDPNSFGEVTGSSVFTNKMVQSIYEMGSIMKPLTMAAGIDSGAVTATTTYDDTGCITVDKKKICNFDFKARGVIPMQQILNQSLNVGASFVATAMGQATMRDYFLNHYQLGSTTGIDLPGEVHGLTSTLESTEQVDYDTAAFGQGMANTPIETVRALATLANGGYLITPHVVSAIQYDSGITQTLSWPAPVRVLKPQTATTLDQMLTEVVDSQPIDSTIRVSGYSIAAKTGTAQIVDPSTGQYYPDLYLHSYFGYFPAYNAKFIVFLFGYEPQGAPYSSDTWPTYFHQLTEFLINYYNIPPDR